MGPGATRPRRPGSRLARLRSSASSTALRTRTVLGVTSTSSSSAIHSRAWSSVISPGHLETDVDLLGLGPVVAQLLGLGGVAGHVARAGVLAHDHARVDGFHGGDEERAPRLQVLQGVAGGRAAVHADQRAPVAVRDLAAPRLVAHEARGHDAQAPGVGEEVAAVADETPGGDAQLQPHDAGAGVVHAGDLALALGQLLDDDALDTRRARRWSAAPWARAGDPCRRAWVMTSGRDTHNSMPSRRISSMRMPRCSSPRPETFTPSGRPRSSTRRATFTRSSRSRRSLIWRRVTAWPSWPENGPLLTRKNMETVGSSISSGGSAGSAKLGRRQACRRS